MSDEQAIRDGERVRLFLEDDAVKAAFERVRHGIIEALTNAENTDDLQRAQAEWRALQRVATALAGTIDDGKRAAAEKARADRIAAQDARYKPKR